MENLVREYKANKGKVLEHFYWKSVLVVGAGNTAGTVIPLLNKGYAKQISLVTLNNAHGEQYLQELDESGGFIYSKVDSDNVRAIEGDGLIDKFYLGYCAIDEKPDVIFLCIPNQRYVEAIQSLSKCGGLRNGQTIVGITGRIGSGYEVAKTIKELGYDVANFTIAIFNTYFAFTDRGYDKNTKRALRTKVTTCAIKQAVSIGLSRPNDKVKNILAQMMKRIGTKAVFYDNTLQAEVTNANIYVHAPVTMTPAILNHIFDPEFDGFLYRFIDEDPKGSLNEDSMLRIVSAASDVNKILDRLGLSSINLLELLVDKLYSVPESIINRRDIHDYLELDPEKQVHLVEKWFRARQFDPFAKGSESTSASDTESELAIDSTAAPSKGIPHLYSVPLPVVQFDSIQNKYIIPVLPAEDFEGLILLVKLAHTLGVHIPTLTKMKNDFETALNQFESDTGKGSSIDVNRIHKHMSELAQEISRMRIKKMKPGFPTTVIRKFLGKV